MGTPKPILPPKPKKRFTFIEILQFTVLGSVILYFGKTLFMPLSFAILISFILYPICNRMEKKGINRSIAIFLLFFLLIILIGSIFYLLFAQLAEFTTEWQILKSKLEETVSQTSTFIAEHFGISNQKQSALLKKTIEDSSSQILLILRSVTYSFTESFFFLIMILVFSALILYHRQLLSNVLYSIFPSKEKKTVHEILIETIYAFYNFIKGMMLVYLIVGILNSIGLAIIGIPNPIMFGFIASLLTFIPYIGIMVASLLPIAVSWIEFNSIWYPLSVILVFTVVQLLEAYIIFPFVVGGRLKINTLAILFAIILGGILWGAIGMILFIPFISILKLIADRTESLKTLSVLLGDGN